MPDDPNIPAEQPETTAPVDETSTEAAAPEAPPWGDDFDPARAWNTIKNLREHEKKAKEFERIQSDEDARREWLTSLGYEIDDGENEEEAYEPLDEDTDPIVAQLSELSEWKESKEQEAYEQKRAADWAGFGEHISNLASEAKMDLSDKDKQRIAVECADKNGWPIGPNEAKKVFDEFMAEREEFRKKVIEEFRSSKKAPTISSGGKTATGTTDVADMDSEQFNQWMAERARALSQ